MVRAVDVNDDFGRSLLQKASAAPEFEPSAYYNEDGDCIEVLLSDESYYSERVDDLLTVYRGQESKEIVGSLIKSVRSFVQDFSKTSPGFLIEVVDGDVRLAHLFTAGIWKGCDEVGFLSYQKLRDTADEKNLTVTIPEISTEV